MMMRTMSLLAVAACTLITARPAAADEWNDRTILTFSAPVMVPGATLPPGSYVFQIAEPGSSRHLVRISREGSMEPVAVTQAVPIKRTDPKSDVVVHFNPTTPGSAPAMKAWFYPGSMYGHEFVYPDDQARVIADRTKSVVLSIDVPGTDVEKGVLRVYGPGSGPAAWQGDAATIREWGTWQRSRSTRAVEAPRATAPAISAGFQGTRVELNELEENPSKFIGQRISVDGEVEEIYGPRLFTIDEPHWGDLDGEMLVLLPTPLAAAVKDNDRVTISGTVRPFARTEIEREWGWLGLDSEIEIDVTTKPILVAERLVGGDNAVAMIITSATASQAVGTSGSSTAASDPGQIAAATPARVGEHVRLTDARVSGVSGNGFFVSAGTRHLFVLPAQAVAAAPGDVVTVEGVILQMPRNMVDRLKGPDDVNESVYIYGTAVMR